MILVGFALAACTATDDRKADGGTGGKSGSGTADQGVSGSAGTAGSSSAGKDGGSSANASGGEDGGLDAGGPTERMCNGEADDIAWGPNGGLVAFTERSAISNCDTYSHTRTPGGSAMPSIECLRPFPCEGSGLHGNDDVLALLARPDVKAAVDQGMALFGTDSRPVDGTVFRIEYHDSIIDVGGDCPASASGCTPIPDSLHSLVALLHSIDDEQLQLSDCKDKFQ
jgi:hypothetical protein